MSATPVEPFSPLPGATTSKTAFIRSFKSKPKSKPSRTLKSGRPPLLATSSKPRKVAEEKASLVTPGTVSVPFHRKGSSKATKTLINAHHNLHKSRAKAHAAGNVDLVADIDAQIGQLGGLKAYQQASLTGQSADRGGDSSVVLVKWLEEGLSFSSSLQSTNIAEENHSSATTPIQFTPESGKHDRRPISATTSIWLTEKIPKYSRSTAETNTEKGVGTKISPGLCVLEIGALSSRNAISKIVGKGLIASVRRIDLSTQEPENIEEVDFMDFPLPTTDSDKYDVISLSLVLNYVPDPSGRGEMLRRTREFLRSEITNETDNVVNGSNKDATTIAALSTSAVLKQKAKPKSSYRSSLETSKNTCEAAHNSSADKKTAETKTKRRTRILPALFIVLPLPCLSNSRYMTVARFRELMYSLGYQSVKSHQSAKLHYELFTLMTKENYPDRDDGQEEEGEEEEKERDERAKEKRETTKFPKFQVNPGPGRNNFCVTLL